jgi:NAD(P)H-nitrite reductase large subunit
MEQYKYVIVGNSAGGMAAVRAIRKTDNEGSLLMLSEEMYPAYSRPLIAKHLSEGKSVDRMRLVPPSFYEEHGIEVRLGTKAVGLDCSEHVLRTEGGGEVMWDRLLLATGSTPIVPPVPGSDHAGVFTFTTFDDAVRIAAHLPAVERAVIVGGGFIGLSAADALRKRNVDVTIVEMLPRVLAGMLDETGSTMVEQAATKAGVRVMTGRRVDAINGDSLTGRTVSSVSLDDGSRLPCEMVIMAVGVRARTELVDGIANIDRGILVDEYMRTSVPDVYCCGDACKTHDYVRGSKGVIAVWPNAVAGGAVAGSNMAGTTQVYDGATTLNALPYFGLAIGSAGVIASPGEELEDISRTERGCYRKVTLKDGIVVGMVFAGDTSKCGVIHSLMKKRVPVGEWKESLVSDDFGLLSLPRELWQSQVTLDD